MRIDRQKFFMRCAEKVINPVDVAKKSGLCVETIYKITAGGNVTTKTLGKVAKALETKPQDLIAE